MTSELGVTGYGARALRCSALGFAAALVGCLSPAAASATDFCVAPNTGCGGTDVASFEGALALADDAPDSDRIFLGAATYLAPTVNGFDYLAPGSPVEIVGQGAGRTIVTSPSAGNGWVLRLVGSPGSSVHDLTIRLPQNVAYGFSGLHTRNAARRLEVIEDPTQANRRMGVDLVNGGTLDDSSVSLSDQGDTAAVMLVTPDVAVRGSTLNAEVGAESYGGAIERVRVTASDVGIAAIRSLTKLTASQITLGDEVATGIIAHPAPGISTTLNADGLTIIGSGGPDTSGAAVSTEPSVADSVQLSLTNSVIRGVSSPLSAEAGSPGVAQIAASYSDYDPSGNHIQGANAKITETNVSNVGDAGFVDARGGDFHLLASSPLLDAGNPVTAQGLDLDGNALVADGNGDGTARRDLGAFERGQAPSTPPASGGPAGSPADTRAPLVSDFRATPSVFAVAATRTPLAARVRRGTRFRYTLDEAAKVSLTIQRALPGRRSSGRCVRPVRRLVRAKRCTRYATIATLARTARTGANGTRFSGRIGKRVLRVGRYRALIRAVDAAGNRSARRATRFRIVRG